MAPLGVPVTPRRFDAAAGQGPTPVAYSSGSSGRPRQCLGKLHIPRGLPIPKTQQSVLELMLGTSKGNFQIKSWAGCEMIENTH